MYSKAENLFFAHERTFLRMFAGKPVQQKFQPSTNISTNHNAALLSQLQSFDIIGWQD